MPTRRLWWFLWLPTFIRHIENGDKDTIEYEERMEWIEEDFDPEESIQNHGVTLQVSCLSFCILSDNNAIDFSDKE